MATVDVRSALVYLRNPLAAHKSNEPYPRWETGRGDRHRPAILSLAIVELRKRACALLIGGLQEEASLRIRLGWGGQF